MSALRLVPPSPGGRLPKPAADLMVTIHEHIVPHLLLLHGLGSEAGPQTPMRHAPTDAEIAQLAEIALREDLLEAIQFIGKALRDGLSMQSVLLDLIAPAARRLGEQAEAGRCPFSEAVAGLTTISQIVELLRSA